MTSRWKEAKQTVLATAGKLVDKGLVVGTSGNVSLRLPAYEDRELLAITPSSRPYDLLDIDDIQIVDFLGNSIEGDLPASIETPLHIGIYRSRQNVGAIIHTHSVFASAVAVAGLEIPPILDDQVVFLGGEIRLAGHTPSGSREQVESSVAALGDRSAVLLPNHGAVGTGRTMREALTAVELIEKTARIFLLARSAGKVNPLPERILETEKALYRRVNSA